MQIYVPKCIEFTLVICNDIYRMCSVYIHVFVFIQENYSVQAIFVGDKVNILREMESFITYVWI